jgi:hypothetical protein
MGVPYSFPQPNSFIIMPHLTGSPCRRRRWRNSQTDKAVPLIFGIAAGVSLWSASQKFPEAK